MRLPKLFFTAGPARDRIKSPSVDNNKVKALDLDLPAEGKARGVEAVTGEANKHILFCLDVFLRS